MITNVYMFSLMLLWLLGSVPRVISQPQLARFSPRSGPTAGGTRISVWGSGFVLSSRCSFARLPAASVPSSIAIVHNSTYMTCIQPVISTAFQFPEGSTQNMIDFRIVTSNTEQSEVENFLVFNLTHIRVTALSPSIGSTLSTDNVVEFTGNKFVNTSELYCFVQELRESAKFIDDQTVSCQLPPFPTASLQYPQLSLNGDVSGFVPADNGSNQFIFFSTAPVLERVQFSSSAAYLILTFDREVEIGTENSSNEIQRFECAAILDRNTTSLLGGGAKCDWQTSQQRVIIVQPTSTSTIMPGDRVTLNGNSTRTRGVEYSVLSTSSVIISQPNGPQPVAILESPGIIPPCGSLHLVARNSLYGGGRPLMYEWSMSSTVSNTALHDMLTAHNSSDISISVELFQSSVDYTFNVTVTNFLGLQDTDTVQIQKPLNTSLVVATIRGSHTRSYPVNSDNIVIEGSAEVRSCPSGGDSLELRGIIEYSWTIADNMSNAISLKSTATNNSELWIPPLTLAIDMTYTVTFFAQLTGQPLTAGNATITITGSHPPITAAINTGYMSSFGSAEDIMLDSSPSLGLLDGQTYQYTWYCGTCGPLPDGFLTSTPSITLSAGSLLPGSYQFTVTITHVGSGMVSTANTIVQVTTHETIPSLRIMLPNMWNSLSTSDRIVVRASVSIPTTATVEWSAVNVQSPGYDYRPVDDRFATTPRTYLAVSHSSVPTGGNVDLSSIIVTSGEDDTSNEISLTINPSVLRSGVSYRLRLNATTEEGNSSVTEFDIMTNSQPTSGTLTVTPSAGTPLETVFTIAGVDWTDDHGDPPLLYQFGFRLSAASTKIYWLTSIRASSKIECILPIANDGIILVVRVYDSSAAYVTYELPFNGLVPTSVVHNALSQLNSIQELITRDGQVTQGLANLMAIAVSMNEFGSRFTNKNTFRITTVDFLLAMSSQVAATKPSLNQILFLMEQVMSEMNFDITIQTRVVTFLEHIVNQYNTYRKGNMFSTPGFNPEEASALFTLYGRMLGGSSVRLQTNSITSSYVSIVDRLGYGLCRQLGLNEEVVLTEENFGSLRLSRTTPVQQYTTCDSDMCPFSQQRTVNIDFSISLFNQYILWQCEASSLWCSGVCLATVQRNRDIFWNGNHFLPHIKSPSLSVLVINPRDGRIERVDNLAQPIQFSFPFISSNSSTLCVFWNVRLATWSSEGCNTRVEADRIICSCDHLTEFTVLAVCPSGYYGDQCQFTCPTGRYGNECANSCMCINGDCSPVDGTCDCDPGYTGSTCNTECTDGYYGDDCLGQCRCMNDADCSHVDGSCQCTAGWTDRFCTSPCPMGRYGANCAQECPCRDDSECDHITGTCTCDPGYTGEDCKQECTNGTYGEGCSRQCSCDEEGTASSTCHHIDGPTCECLPDYTGQLCQTYTVLPSPTPPPTPTSSGFPIALAIIPILILLIIVVIIVIIIAQWRWKKHRSGKMKIIPLEEGDGSQELITKQSEGEKSRKDDDGIFITRTKSLTVIVPPGAKLQDIFTESQPGTISAFKEPLEMGGKFRWQIIHIKEKTKRDSATVLTKNDTFGSQENLISEDEDEKELALKQVPYHQGVYADADASLRDVRDLFLETGQLESDQLPFQFLDLNSRNRLYAVEEEEVITLDSMELSARKLPRTLFIKSIPDSKESRLDFCLCGRVADFECTDCGNRGYCSVGCQQDDWHKHMVICKKQRRKKKQKKKKKKKGPYQLRSPDPTMCVCGAPAEMECSQCGVQGYCSEKCQIADWDEHQLNCEPQDSSKPATPINKSDSVKDEEPLPPDNTTADTTKQEGSNTSLASVDEKNDTASDKEDLVEKDDKSEHKGDNSREGSLQSLIN